MLQWMVWTLPTAMVFVGLAVLLTAMAVWAKVSPPVARRGFLRIETDRGDRLYIGLVSAGLVLAGWIAVSDLSMWWALGCALLVMLVIGLWG